MKNDEKRDACFPLAVSRRAALQLGIRETASGDNHQAEENRH
jgi:hypothetical protein